MAEFTTSGVEHIPGNAVAPKAVGAVRWLIIACVFVVAAVSYLDRNNISIAASFVQRDFHLSNVQLGVVFSSFITGYAFSQPLAGFIADRFGPTRVIAIAIFWWSVFTALVPFVPAHVRGAMGILLAVRFLTVVTGSKDAQPGVAVGRRRQNRKAEARPTFAGEDLVLQTAYEICHG